MLALFQVPGEHRGGQGARIEAGIPIYKSQARRDGEATPRPQQRPGALAKADAYGFAGGL